MARAFTLIELLVVVTIIVVLLPDYTSFMCGRYTLHADTEQLIRRFLLGREPKGHRPRYNIAPSQLVAVVQSVEGKREMVEMKWGLVPSWAKDPSIGHKMINARAETLGEKPAFREALRKRRCLVVADGFYEWRKEGKEKTPMHIHRGDGEPFGFAGLWEKWVSRDTGEELRTCTIVTTEPNELMATIHSRMPAILTPEDEAKWLDPDVTDPAKLLPLLKPYPADLMTTHPVSRQVNSPAHEGPGCIEPAAEEGLF